MRATPEQIRAWSAEPDYGICLQTRTVRALDIDVPEPAQALPIIHHIEQYLGALPARGRSNTGKKLLAFTLRGEFTKRSFHTEGGLVEFLATGQQFIVAGTHPSGVRYEWDNGLPEAFPEIDATQFEALWQSLVDRFSVDGLASESQAPIRAQRLKDVLSTDAVAQYLVDKDWVKRVDRSGRIDIKCPFEDEHTGDTSDSSTSYWPAHTGGFAQGHFQCLHAHCAHRKDQDFLDGIGFVNEAMLTEFSDISDLPAQVPQQATMGGATDQQPQAAAYTTPDAGNLILDLNAFLLTKAPTWLVKGVLPQAELAVVFAPHSAGKSFFVLDLTMAVARGVEWRGLKVRQGGVVYVVAEGRAGFRNRVAAYLHQHNLKPEDVPLFRVAPYAPNIMEKADALALAKAVHAGGDPAIIVVDTLAQTTPGANENSGEDMGRALAHCRGLHRATGALVILIHHSGKDSTKGARGWSGLQGAADTIIELMRSDDDRVATVTKQKDGTDGAEFGFRLTPVPIGFDADGDEITSCLVEPAAVGRAEMAKRREPGKIEKVVLKVFDDLMLVGEEGVAVNDLIQGTVDQLVPEEDGKRDRRRNKAHQALQNSLDKGLLRVVEGRVFYPESGEG